jgi:hypothetical protein
MTRFLSEALQAEEPQFRLGLRQLEAANGAPSTDIRLSSAIHQETRTKLRELGLDPDDTSPGELYYALEKRIAQDDRRLTQYLRAQAATHVSAEGDIVAGMVHAIHALPDTKICFGIKHSSLKKMLLAHPPKKAMHQLHYRSINSFLKHEPALLALAAAWLSEGDSWQAKFLSSYKKLESHDFETRTISLLEPRSPQWKQFSKEIMKTYHHTILSFKELGAIVFMPLSEDDVPAGSVTATLCLALHELNEIRACSTYLKLNQVRPDFGKLVKEVAISEPKLNSTLLNQPLPWNLIQRYYSRIKSSLSEAIFEPYVQLEEMNWYSVEKQLAQIDPALHFWRHTSFLGLVDAAKKPVSLNIVDAALNYVNQLSFEDRVVQYFQRSLWHELLLRYMKQDPVDEAVLHELQPAYAEETA